MKHGLRSACIAVAFLLATGTATVSAESFAETYNSAVDAFDARDFLTAGELFRSAASVTDGEDSWMALFWAGRSFLAAGRTDTAGATFRRYLEVADPTHTFVPEARYQLGRVAFIEATFQQALRVFDAFMEDYPDSPLVANALYWSGESLLALGRPEEAEMLFTAVLSGYPESPRFESARYRRDIIELSRREQELIELLRLSAEEQVKLADDLVREREAHRATREGLVRVESEELQRAERALEQARQEAERGRQEVETMRAELERRIEAVRLQEEVIMLIGAYADWLEEQE